ncbi:MAG: PAS domain S-box protein [Myxococcales bacterium]|nr:PAS domain S-box protein [Myxococcales bacterium]
MGTAAAGRGAGPSVFNWEAEAEGLCLLSAGGDLARWLGVLPTAALAERVTVESLVHPDDREGTLALCRAVSADGTARAAVHRLLGAEGRKAWFRTEVSGLREGGGPVRRLAGRSSELPRPAGERPALGFAGENLAFILGQIPAIVAIVDPELVVGGCIGGGLQPLDLLPGQLTGVRFPELLQADERSTPLLAAVRRAFSGELVALDLSWGSRWYELRLGPLRAPGGEIMAALLMALDVTVRRRAEVDLRESEERFRRLSEATFEGIALHDRGLILDANDQLAKMFGYAAGELVGKHAFDLAAPESRQEVEERIRSGSEEAYRAAGIRRDGSRVPLEVRGKAVRYKGRAARITALRDISELVAAEQERTRLLEDARAAVAARDEFLSIASHELRTPCASLLLTIQALQRRVPAGPAGEQSREDIQGKLEILERQTRRLTALIEELLDVSRLRAGRMDLRLEPVDLAAAAAEAIAGLHAEADRAGVAVVARLEGPLIGRWDVRRVDQIVTNLVSNAIKFGSGRPVEVSASPSEETARLEVKDQGIGISPEDQLRIFQPFERLVSSRRYGGLGLGLFIVRKIVDALGGSIDVQSELGVGSTFTVELPLAGPRGEPSGPRG